MDESLRRCRRGSGQPPEALRLMARLDSVEQCWIGRPLPLRPPRRG
ncbi:hypothetical protein I553_6880 [Mycobacterium xenopi 4042]|uniref:Uncharacterized protein n=1 Tax=Mycobacterium xenopi 4042 TaxID=1299334 RepID=X7Z410_MYCXE|nr:hypothetical protein I553_6880 [Mycobacterium xenopi 4042]